MGLSAVVCAASASIFACRQPYQAAAMSLSAKTVQLAACLWHGMSPCSRSYFLEGVSSFKCVCVVYFCCLYVWSLVAADKAPLCHGQTLHSDGVTACYSLECCFIGVAIIFTGEPSPCMQFEGSDFQ